MQGGAEQTTKDQSLKTGFDKYMKDENKKLLGYKESVTIYNNMSKKYVSEINVRKLKSLVSKQNVNNLFKFLFTILYDKNESEYDSAKFAKLALDTDADDFQIKLASFNTIKLHENRGLAESFKKIKDQDFRESESNQDLSNLLNWMDYVHEMYLAEVEYKQQQENVKINQSEFGERLLKITLSEEDNVRKRQAIQIYKNAMAQIEQDKRLLDTKKNLVGNMNTNIRIDASRFQKEYEAFRQAMYDHPNHL